VVPGKKELLTFDRGAHSRKERSEGVLRWVVRDSAGAVLAANSRAVTAWQEAYVAFQRRAQQTS